MHVDNSKFFGFGASGTGEGFIASVEIEFGWNDFRPVDKRGDGEGERERGRYPFSRVNAELSEA